MVQIHHAVRFYGYNKKNAFASNKTNLTKPTCSFYSIFIVPRDTCGGRQPNRWDG